MSRELISDETKAKICELWNRGMTTSKIGENLGITKNSVVGIVNRLRKAGVHLQERGSGTFKVKKPRPLVRKPEKKIRPVYGSPVDIMGLAFRSCRFIVEEGDERSTKYCNSRIYDKSFCREHHDLCYVPVKPKRPKLNAY
jgi:hypothetical protein